MLWTETTIKISRKWDEIDEITNKFVETIIYENIPATFWYIERKHFENKVSDIQNVQNYYFWIDISYTWIKVWDLINFSDFNWSHIVRIIKEPRKTVFISDSFIKLIWEKIW